MNFAIEIHHDIEDLHNKEKLIFNNWLIIDFNTWFDQKQKKSNKIEQAEYVIFDL